MCARTNKCYNERGSRTNHFRSSITHCILDECHIFKVTITLYAVNWNFCLDSFVKRTEIVIKDFLHQGIYFKTTAYSEQKNFSCTVYDTLRVDKLSFQTIIMSYQSTEQRIPFTKPNYNVTLVCSVCWPSGKIPKGKRKQKKKAFCILNSLNWIETEVTSFWRKKYFWYYISKLTFTLFSLP
jgi:hypothetical protein